MIPTELSRILITDTGEQQVIWLKERNGDRSFPILIGIVEAHAIERKLNDKVMERPLTHDLFANTLNELDVQVERVVVTALRGRTFYANIILQRDGEKVEVDSRPSDAIALAVRVDAPIFVEEEVFDDVGRSENQTD